MRFLFIAALMAASPATAQECDTVGAWAAVTQNVSAQLRAPATAQHPDLSSVAAIQAEGRCFWTFEAHVDAENGFGAMIRAEYTALVQQGQSGFTVMIRDFTSR